VTADVRRLEQSEQGRQIGGLGRSGKGHDGAPLLEVNGLRRTPG
jgi:hypothetical protein